MATVTIRMLAKELSLSIATVSKALADSHEISRATKDSVLETAKRFGYVANPYASSLRKRRSKTIAVVLPEVADSFFSQAINGIESVALAYGYHVLIYLTHESFAREATIMDEFRSGRVDGILISVSEETSSSEHIKRVMDANTPVIFFDRVCEDLDTACIVTDDFESSIRAVMHLAESGCKKIAFLGTPTHLSISMNRLKGYEQALHSLGLVSSGEQVVICGKDDAENYRLLKNVLESKDRPDGIIASVEKLAMLVYTVCHDLHLTVAEDVKVITFTNLKLAQFMNPSLTTVNQPAFEIGKTAATLLFKALNRPEMTIERETITLPSQIIARASSGSKL